MQRAALPARVLIVGAGGLGCPVSLSLAQRGVRHLTLIDDDVVDVTNLQRQPWHHLADVGRPKVESAATKLRAAFPHLTVDARQERLLAANALARFAEHDLVIDATDGVETKFLLSDASVLSGVPSVYAGVLRFEGLAMRIEPRAGPCLRCLFETPPEDAPTCAQAGVLGSMAGVIGGVQAALACAAIQPPVSMLHVIDGLHLSFRTVKVRRRDDCPACGAGANPVLIDRGTTACDVSTSPARSAP